MEIKEYGEEESILLRPGSCDGQCQWHNHGDGNLNVTIGGSMEGVVRPHGLERQTSDNDRRLVAFANANGLYITNTIFPHKRIHEATGYPPDPRTKPSLKDYVMVKNRLRPSVLDTCVYRQGDLDSDYWLVVVSLRLRFKRKETQCQVRGLRLSSSREQKDDLST